MKHLLNLWIRHKTDAHGKLVIENDEIVSDHHRIVI